MVINGVTWTRTITFTEEEDRVDFTLNGTDFVLVYYATEGRPRIRIEKDTPSLCAIYVHLVFKEESDVGNVVETLSFNEAIITMVVYATKLALHKKYSCRFHMHIVDPAHLCSECGVMVGL
jgi:hypothetical protein